MIYTIEKITHDTRVALGLNGKSQNPIWTDSPQLRIEEAVHLNAPRLAAEIISTLPTHELTTRKEFAEWIVWNDQETWGWTMLPADFLRLVVFRMSDWKCGVNKLIDSTSANYAMQKSRVRGIGACPERPVCTLASRTEGDALEFYGSKSQSAKVRLALYAPWPDWDENLGLDLPPAAYHPLISGIIANIRNN